MKRLAPVLMGLAAFACAKPAIEAPRSAEADAQGAAGAVVSSRPTPRASSRIENIVWKRMDAAAAPGSILLFASDGAMLMTSCVETYRIARWRAVDGDTIAWDEDGMSIEADYALDAAGAMTLALKLVGETVEHSFSRIGGDALCPPKL